MIHDRTIRWGRFVRALLMFLGLIADVAMSAHAQPVTLDVAFKLTDLDYHPLPNVPVRLVFGSDPD